MTETDTCDQILHDIRNAAPFDGLGTTPPRDIAAAYNLQDAVTAALTSDPAYGPVAGWKIAANSAALLARFGIDEPASGRVFSAQSHDSPAKLRSADYRQFALEPEIAAVMGKTLRAEDAPHDRETVKSAIERFVPAMELLDMRDADMPSIHLPDAIAQNISNVGAVLGGPGVAPDQLDITTLRMTIDIEGETRHDVTGAAPQHPLETVVWLANHIAARGLSLEAGQFVLCGTHSPICYHEGKGEITLSMSGLGKASLTLA